MVICPPETKGLRSHCFSSGLITDVSVSDCSSPPLSSLEKVCRKPKPTRRCLSSEAFWVIGVVFGVIVVCGNEGASGFALGRDLGSRGAKASCISGPLWVMLANDLAPNEGGMFMCSSTQDPATKSRDILSSKHEPCSLKRRRQIVLKISTFNLLAPCYKRVAPALEGSVSPKGPVHRNPFSVEKDDKYGISRSSSCVWDNLKANTVIPVTLQLKTCLTERNGLSVDLAPFHHFNSNSPNIHFSRESEFYHVWNKRASELVDFIQEHLAPVSDIMCFQEWWFDPDFERIFQSKLLEHFSFHTYQRTGHKTDGLAILLKKGEEGWKVIASSKYSLGRIGNRVALLLHLQQNSGSKSSPPVEMVLCNTHLSFPHSEFDRALQRKQVETLVHAIEGYVEEQGLCDDIPRIVCGDFNLEESDGAFTVLRDAGYVSAHSCQILHGDSQMVTHNTHRGEQVRVDHVWVKAQELSTDNEDSACVRELALLPHDMDSRHWCDEFQLSDHRPLYAYIDITTSQ